MNDVALSRLARLETELAALRRGMNLVPLHIPPQASRWTVLQVVGGNTLPVTANAGVKRVTSAPASIPDYDLTTSPTCVDGIGYARDYFTGQLALIALAPPSLILTDLWASDIIECYTQVQYLITASSPARYRPVWVPAVVQG